VQVFLCKQQSLQLGYQNYGAHQLGDEHNIRSAPVQAVAGHDRILFQDGIFMHAAHTLVS
jgi:hypothetical protein